MRPDGRVLLLARGGWLLLGGVGAAFGSWRVLGASIRPADNADSFGGLIAGLSFSLFIVLAGLGGAIAGVLLGLSVEGLLRRLGLGSARAVGLATLLVLVALGPLWAIVEARTASASASTPPARDSSGSTFPRRCVPCDP